MTAEPMRRMDPDDRRQQILTHALRLFESRPYSDVSMGDIAEAAGVARPLVHHYFGTKRGVYLAALERLTALPAMALSELPRDSARSAAAAVIDHVLSVVERHQGTWVSMLVLTSAGADEEARTIITEADESAGAVVLAALGVELGPEDRRLLRGASSAYGALGREATRQWLVEGNLSREQCSELLTVALTALIAQFGDAGVRP